MTLCLSRDHQRQLLEWAEKASPSECCGFLLGAENQVQAVTLARNVAIDHTVRFEIDPAQLIAAERSARGGGSEILGYFHSHPNGHLTPSKSDAVAASPDGRLWIVIAGGYITCWQSSSSGAVHGRFNPVHLEIVDHAS